VPAKIGGFSTSEPLVPPKGSNAGGVVAEKPQSESTASSASQTADQVTITTSALALQKLPGARVPRGTGIAAGVAERWRTLLELMAGCRTSNEVNGYIINLRQGRINQLIGVVRGASPVTYTSQGKTLAKALRALAKA
jgi:flagellar biosynthesis/type III secretory pathway chaperone